MTVIPTRIQHPTRNSLLGGTVRHSFLACFPLAFTGAIGSFVDVMLAGTLFSPHHLTSVGIAASVGVLVTAILMILAHGSYASYSYALGRGQRRKCREIFSVGIILICLLGLLLALLLGRLAVPVTRLFGAATAELQQESSQYLRFALFSYPLTALNYMLMLVAGIYGYRRQVFLSTLLNFLSNVLLSLLFIRILPGIGLGALGLGTIGAGILSLAAYFLLMPRGKLPLLTVPRLEAFGLSRTRVLLTSGLTTSANMLIDGLIGAVINRIIVSSALGEMGLTVFSVVSCFWRVAQVPSDAMDYAVVPLFGICYVLRDRSALKKAAQGSILQGFAYSLLWVLLLDVLSGALISLYVIGDDSALVRELAQRGAWLTLAFTPVYCIARMLTSLYDAADSLPYSLATAIIPDSVLFPLMLLLLLPRYGYTGIWLSLGGNTAVYLLGLYLLHILLSRRFPVTADCFFHLDDGLCAEYPQIDVSIGYDDADISRLSEEIMHFLKQEQAGSRISYLTALCTDELATDIVSHSKRSGSAAAGSLMDVKMISEPDDFQIILRNAAKPYNPLDFDYNNTSFSKVGVMIAQRFAKKIDYDYVYNFNMLTIRIAKQSRTDLSNE